MSVTLNLKTEKIRRIRRNKDISQEYIAGKLDFTQPHYSRIENGKCSIELQKAKLIADLLEVHVCDILDLDGIENMFFKNTENEQKIEVLLQENTVLSAQNEELKTDKKQLIEHIKVLEKLLKEKNQYIRIKSS